MYVDLTMANLVLYFVNKFTLPYNLNSVCVYVNVLMQTYNKSVVKVLSCLTF
jgi:hypothetical protein